MLSERDASDRSSAYAPWKSEPFDVLRAAFEQSTQGVVV